MSLIVIALVIGLAAAVPLQNSEIARPKADNSIYRLPTALIPQRYVLNIKPDLTAKTFRGSVSIEILVKNKTDEIILHNRYLQIYQSTVSVTDAAGKTLSIKEFSNTRDKEFYHIVVDQSFEINKKYVLNIAHFSGYFRKDEKRGFYYGEYREDGKLHPFATTHFEPTSARAAFPCFDEPGMKAKFKIFIARPREYSSYSNGAWMTSSPPTEGSIIDEFEETPIMSTYLVAFIITDMELSPKQPNSIHQILARKSFIEKQYEKYALATGKAVLDDLGKFLSFNYTLPNMIQAAIPDEYFTPGAMENWGLVIYRESYLLLKERTRTIEQQGIDTIIAHEFAHQWFGNLATQSWWEYLWLSEGFASYFQYKTIDRIKTDWKMMDQFVVLVTQNVFQVDSTSRTRAMNLDAGSPAEISRLFDAIAYSKSGAIIRMIEAFLTTETFEKGLAKYLQEKKYKTATPNDLYSSLQKALDESKATLPDKLTVSKIMTTWDSQKGFPLVTVTRNYKNNVDKVALSQARFITDNTTGKAVYTIPINYAIESKDTFDDLRATHSLSIEKGTITVKDLTAKDWIIVNKQEAYYYRVNYDETNWKLLTDALAKDHAKIHVRNRAQLIDDSFTLAKMDVISYSIPFDLSSYLRNEIEYVPLQSFLRHMSFLNGMISGTATEPYFRNYVISALEGAYKKIQFDEKESDSHIDKLIRVDLITWLCNFNHRDCTIRAYASFFKWWHFNVRISADLEGPVLCGAMRRAPENDWDSLYYQFMRFDDPTLNLDIAAALGCSENITILHRFFDLTFKSNFRFELKYAIGNTTKSGSFGVNASLKYLTLHLPFLELLIDDKDLEAIVYSIGSRCTTHEQIDELHRLSKKSKDSSLFTKGIDKARDNADWNTVYLDDIHVLLNVTRIPIENSAFVLKISLILNVVLLTILYIF